jgi:hypothetical protein
MLDDELIKKLKYRPRIVGEYSHVFTIPAWWMKINGHPEYLEVIINLHKLELRPSVDRKENGNGR